MMRKTKQGWTLVDIIIKFVCAFMSFIKNAKYFFPINIYTRCVIKLRRRFADDTTAVFNCRATADFFFEENVKVKHFIPICITK